MSIWVVIKRVKPFRERASVLETKEELGVEQMLLCVENQSVVKESDQVAFPQCTLNVF